MWAVIGLGNPGAEYEQTRHNIGFWVVDRLAEEFAGRTKWREKGGSLFIKTEIAGEECFLVKPQQFMNRSGVALRPVLEYFELKTKELLVVHDELDLDPGVVRFKRGGSAGGHNGLKDIIAHCGADFFRVRIGIGHPRTQDRPEMDVSDWVLGRARGEERKILESAVSDATRAIELFIAEGLEKVQQEFHRRK